MSIAMTINGTDIIKVILQQLITNKKCHHTLKSDCIAVVISLHTATISLLNREINLVTGVVYTYNVK